MREKQKYSKAKIFFQKKTNDSTLSTNRNDSIQNEKDSLKTQQNISDLDSIIICLNIYKEGIIKDKLNIETYHNFINQTQEVRSKIETEFTRLNIQENSSVNISYLQFFLHISNYLNKPSTDEYILALQYMSKYKGACIENGYSNLVDFVYEYTSELMILYQVNNTTTETESNMIAASTKISILCDHINTEISTKRNKTISNTLLLIIIFIILILILSILISASQRRNITGLLKLNVDQAISLASGNLKMNIIEYELDLKNEMGDLARSMKKMVSKLSEIMLSVKTNAASISAASNEIESASNMISHGAADQAASIE